jgi:neuroligin
MSGSGAAPWSLVEDPVHYAVKLAATLNCSLPTNMLKNHLQLVDCLRYLYVPM